MACVVCVCLFMWMCLYVCMGWVGLDLDVCLIGSNLSSTGAIPSSPVRSLRLISSICSCTEMKRVKRKRNEANLDIRPDYIITNH